MKKCINDDEALSQLEERLGLRFMNRNLLIQALTHSTHLNECPQHPVKEHYQRLEFIGDAVLELIVTEFLFIQFPRDMEGVLTNKRMALVNGKVLSSLAQEVNLEKFIFMSNGERFGPLKARLRMLCDVTEALIGAVYLDKGLEAARQFVGFLILDRFQEILGAAKDYKTELLELVQARFALTPAFQLVSTLGPDHNPRFIVECLLEGQAISSGEGTNKHEAQIAAAQKALGTISEWEGRFAERVVRHSLTKCRSSKKT